MLKDAISYKVTVEAIVERVEKAGKSWEVIGDEPVEGSDNLGRKMGYTPEIEKTVRREVQVYQQTVDSLDMAKLVSVVNSAHG